MIKIGNIEIHGKLFLAPMAGFSNQIFRGYALSFGANLAFTEMVSDMALIYNNQETIKMISRAKGEKILAVQLFGSNPKSMATAAKIIENLGADIIDINMGCPVNKIVKSHSGSYLLKDLDLAYEIAKSVVESVNVPVTAKIRLGFSKNNFIADQLAKRLESAGVKMISVHGRTREQFYSGKSDWDSIKLVKDAVKIPVIANGDITSGIDCLKVLELTGCDGIMIGRASIGNPWIFKQCDAAINKKEYQEPSLNEKIEIAKNQIFDLIDLKGKVGALESRALACYFIKGLKNCSKYRQQFVKCSSKEEFCTTFEQLLLEQE